MFAVPGWQWALAKPLILTQHIAMVNILAGREIVPEFVPFNGSPLPVARACVELLSDAAKRAAMVEELRQVVQPLLPARGVLASDAVATEVGKLVLRILFIHVSNLNVIT
jgi:lipid-A-disaccharide synthase